MSLRQYRWSLPGHYLAVAHAETVEKARALLLEEIGEDDGSCVERAAALLRVREIGPQIYFGANAEFALTHNAETEEANECNRRLRQLLKAHGVPDAEINAAECGKPIPSRRSA